MSRMSLTGQRLIALFLLGCLLLNFPLLYLFERAATLGGVPVLFVYVFVAWIAIVALLAIVVERDDSLDAADKAAEAIVGGRRPPADR